MAGKTSSSKKEDPGVLIEAYKEMLFYRRFEERTNLAYTQRKFSGFCHLHIGQEAVCVGVQRALRPTDHMISGYRSHTQAIAKGIPEGQVLAELYGKISGCAGGKGGSMHMFSKEKRFYGGHGIVGGQVPLAAGIGFAIKYRKEKDVVVCYLGDGASNQGQFFEALNLAATWKLPCLFIIENNQYGMGTDFHRVTSVDHLYKRALAFDMDHGTVDGMSFVAVHEATKKIVEEMRESSRPYLFEVNTYRYRGHSVSDPGTYRTKEEVQKYQERDPIQSLGAHLKEKKLATEDDLKIWDKEAKQRFSDAEAFADSSERPPIEDIWKHVYQD